MKNHLPGEFSVLVMAVGAALLFLSPVSPPLVSSASGGALNKSLHGRPITVTGTTITLIHTMQGVTLGHANIHGVHLEISNATATSVVAMVHYNNGAIYVTVPGWSTRPVDITCESDSPACTVANSHVAVSGAAGGTLTVAGGYCVK